MADFNTHVKKIYVPPSSYKITTGTWTLTSTSGIMYYLKTATAETSIVSIPIALPSMVGDFGQKLTKIEVPLRITGADLSSVVVGTLYQVNDYKAVTTPGTNIDTTVVTITETGTSVTLNAADRRYIATITTPAWSHTSTITAVHYQLDLSLVCAASTVVRAYGADAYYEDLG